jgi:ABC-type bacteriocin/lantibiotic exporter with double-glycine peptidase domain
MAQLPSIVHQQQLTMGYCLPACTQMALGSLGMKITQNQLAAELGTAKGIGTPFTNLQRLTKYGVTPSLSQWQSIQPLLNALKNGWPVITAILTTPGLPGWETISTQHAILIVQIYKQDIVYHDPALAHGPVTALLDEFYIGWTEMSEQTAILRRL